MVRLVEQAKEEGDTLGGAVTVIAHNVPAGLGSHVQWNEKLDGRLVEGRLEHGFEGLDVGDRVRVRLIGTNVERGFIDFAREHGRTAYRRPCHRRGCRRECMQANNTTSSAVTLKMRA